MLVLVTPYIPQIVESTKSLPYTERRYDGNRKVWFVDPKHGQKLVTWIKTYAGETVSLPNIASEKPKIVTRLFEVRYIGACKNRGDGSSVAFGMVGNDWSLIFSENVLRSWFDSENTGEVVEQAQTLYQVLGIKKSATEDEIKTGFRRMARQWHPDVCKEPNAHEVFIRIQEAYNLLSDTNKRLRYDAGLKLQKEYEKQLKNNHTLDNLFHSLSMGGYRTPLRCGMIMVEGIEKLGRLDVTKILAWEDIVKNGKTLVTSWPMGAKVPMEIWS